MRRPLDPRDIPDELRRRLGLLDAVVIGLGSMIGAGIFAALAPAAYAAGSGLLLGLAVAAVVAYCNAISSARLAARYPASGGTYVYGRMRLGDFWGYLAGWGFVVGKTASCAAMALTVGFYVWPAQAHAVAVAVVVALTAVNYAGIQKSAWLTRSIVAVVLVVLTAVVVAAYGSGAADPARLDIGVDAHVWGMLQAAGLLFFAFAGYARIATLGEEVRDPARTIPRAIPLALGITLAVYAMVAVAVIAVLGPQRLARAAAPLSEAMRVAGVNWLIPVVQIGAAVAALGSLLALILGVSTDGIIRAGRTALDVSAITGESVPVEVGPGDEVFAGSINGLGVLQVGVTATAANNSLARIVHIVEAEQVRKGASQRLADCIARPLVPSIMIAAALIAGTGSVLGNPLVWIERALVVLVAAAPCALAIAVPVTVVASIGAASRLGVLIKGGAALETLGTIRAVALDKTGTLTANRPVVIDVATTNGATREEVLAVAAALEARSEHPLAVAVLAATQATTAASDVQAVPGAGLIGRLDGRVVRLGRPGWLDAAELADHVACMQQAGATAVLVERDQQLLGAIAVRDELRPEAAEVVAGLRTGGYQVTMLTGDNHATAAALAAQAGIEQVHAELRPEDKAHLVAQLRARQPTAMVGDGVNDAPALAAADLGIAMGAMGTDVAIETADVALMGQDLRHLPQALDHARRSRQIMVQNVGLSLSIITVLMPLALFGILGLAAVVLVHEFTEVIVIANGVRAGRIKPLAGPPKTPDRTIPG
ncbi:heavy metal translocating P-type ATPase [Mycobacterium tuberculosis]|uniref:heavy metal translocating P-type ATPase n=2 Tax=Mycobacterium tuberculosis TaxID=1773 RepID=UPI0039EC9C5E